jgi:GNAT superfamily N-acetyltransferase
LDLFNYRKIGGQTLTSKVDLEPTIQRVAEVSDYRFNGESSFTVPTFKVPQDFSLGVIFGPSGSGKSTLLKEMGGVKEIVWKGNLAIASQVEPNLLMKIGLSSIPSLCRPYHVLSTGEKHRAEIAISLKDGCVIDEFTSVCNRDLAHSISVGVRNVIDHYGYRNVVIATCHEDVINWLEPDWVANTLTRRLVEGRSERLSSDFRVLPCSTEAWSVFCDHHYLSSEINKSAHCWLLVNEHDTICGFGSAIPFPSRDLRNAWREHRTVILPDFQGMGLGSKLSNAVAKMFYDRGCRYFSKTAHPKLGEHRNNSEIWKPTSMNKVSRKNSYQGMGSNNSKKRGAYTSFDYEAHADRLCYSHEYIGDGTRLLKGQEDRSKKQDNFFGV